MNIQQTRSLVKGQTVFCPSFSYKAFTIVSIRDKEEYFNSRYFKMVEITDGINKYITSSLALELCLK